LRIRSTSIEAGRPCVSVDLGDTTAKSKISIPKVRANAFVRG
jgi:hypothetical protein